MRGPELQLVARFRDELPYPVASPYAIVGQADEPAETRRWALCFTAYQLLRTVCLPLVAQYLGHDPAAATEVSRSSARSLNTAIAAIRTPFFSDWIALLFALKRHLPKLGIEPAFPALAASVEAVRRPEERPVSLRGRTRLDPLHAILALRNETAHGGIVDRAEAARHLEHYLPVLHEALGAFDWLADHRLEVLTDDPTLLSTGEAEVRTLRGATLTPPAMVELDDARIDAFERSSAIITSPDGERAVPLHPLLRSIDDQEAIYLYDGHSGRRATRSDGDDERAIVIYLGVRHTRRDASASDDLRALLEAHEIDFFLDRSATAPWTIAESAQDASRRTLQFVASKYRPECYVPFESLEATVGRFLDDIPDRERWPKTPIGPLFVNGMILAGEAGSGKTAFLARLVDRLLEPPEDAPGEESSNLVLFLRGDGIQPRPDGVSLFLDVAERLGIATSGAGLKAGKSGGRGSASGFSSFRELIDHLHARAGADQVAGRRMIIVLDALNEAPFPELCLREAVEMVCAAASVPWLKIILSVRQEWLDVWSSKLAASEQSILERARPYVDAETAAGVRDAAPAGLPVRRLERFGAGHAEAVYGKYQFAASSEVTPPIRACTTPWAQLDEPTRTLLTNPLHLYLFMQAFDARPASGVVGAPDLFRSYVEATIRERPGIEGAIDAVIDHLLEDVARPTADLDDDDVNRIRRRFEEGHTAGQVRLLLSPLEALACEGWISKRTSDDGGGYRFTYQRVAEFLVYRRLARAVGGLEGAATLDAWKARTEQVTVFPEYAGAFGFLLRDWADQARLEWVGPLVEHAPAWLTTVAAQFLVDRAAGDYVPGQGSRSADAMASSFEAAGRRSSAKALLSAAQFITSTRLALAALPYLRSATAIIDRERAEAAGGDDSELETQRTWALLSIAGIEDARGRHAAARDAYREIVETASDAIARVSALCGLGGILARLGDTSGARGAFEEARDLAAEVRAARPDDPATNQQNARVLNALGFLHNQLGEAAEAATSFEHAIESTSAFADDARPEATDVRVQIADAHLGHAYALKAQGRFEDADGAFARSYDAFAEVHREHPSNLGFLHAACVVLQARAEAQVSAGRYDLADGWFAETLRLRREMSRLNPESAVYRDSLADLLESIAGRHELEGDEPAAEEAYREAFELVEAAHLATPEDATSAVRLCGLLVSLGHLRSGQGDGEGALALFDRARSIAAATLDRDPDREDALLQHASASISFGQQLMDDGRPADAEELVAGSVARLRSRWVEAGSSVGFENVLAAALEVLGLIHRALGRFDEAERDLGDCERFRKELAERDRFDLGLWLGWARATSNLGLVWWELGRYADMERALDASATQSRHVWSSFGEKVEAGLLLAQTLTQQAYSFSDIGRLDDALDAAVEAVELATRLHDDDLGNVWVSTVLVRAEATLARCHLRLGQPQDAAGPAERAVALSERLSAERGKALQLRDGQGLGLVALGAVHAALGRPADAIARWRQASDTLGAHWSEHPGNVDFGPALGDARLRLGEALMAAGDLDGAREALRLAYHVLSELADRNGRSPEVGCRLATITALRARLGRLEGDDELAADASALAITFGKRLTEESEDSAAVIVALAQTLLTRAEIIAPSDLDRARPLCGVATSALDQAVAKYPKVLAARLAFARALDLSAAIARARGETDAASASSDQASRLWDELEATHPGHAIIVAARAASGLAADRLRTAAG